MNDELLKLLSAGRFPNHKNRIWTMCQVVIKLALATVEEAEKWKMTDEQFYISFEDILNEISVKDHSINDSKITSDIQKFIEDDK